MDYYQVLGVAQNANADEIKHAYRRLAKEFHPDKCFDNNQNSHEKMQNLNVAFDVLKDPQKRMLYDMGFSKNDPEPDNFDWTGLTSTLFHLFTKLKKKTDKAKEDKTTHNKQNININLVVKIEEIAQTPPPVKKVSIKVLRYKGNKRKIVLNDVYVPLINYAEERCIENEGDEFSPGCFGDVIVKINVENNQFYINDIFSPYDLYYEHPVSIYDYIYGNKCEILHIDKKTSIQIEYDGKSNVSKYNGLGVCYIDKNEDEKRGNFYIVYKVYLPNITDELLKYCNTKPIFKEVLKCLHEYTAFKDIP